MSYVFTADQLSDVFMKMFGRLLFQTSLPKLYILNVLSYNVFFSQTEKMFQLERKKILRNLNYGLIIYGFVYISIINLIRVLYK